MNNLLKSIVEHEDFSSTAYPDPLSKGAPYTFGHGLTTITESESLEIVKNRVTSIISALSIKLPYFSKLPDDAKDVLVEMAFQLGIGPTPDGKGLLSFRKTLSFVKSKDFVGASKEMLNSKWAKQTPKRALALSRKMAFCLHQN